MAYQNVAYQNARLLRAQLRRGAGVFRPVGPVPRDIAVAPELPPGDVITLPGRGPVFVRRADGPAGEVPLLLLHGVTWSADINFHGVLAPLAKTRPVIAMDQRGHGRGLPIAGPVEIEDLADDAVAVLDALGIERAIFGGFSLGCLVSLQAALRHRDRVAGLVLGAGSLYYRDLVRDRLFLAAVRPATVFARRGLGATIAARYFGMNRARRNEEFRRIWPWLRAELARTPASSVLAVLGAVARYDLRHRVESLRELPSAVVLTTGDTICHPRMQQDLAERLGARIVRVDGDHDLPFADPDAYREAMLTALTLVTR
ncbi:alpha/beta fold hydrolase [Amycolatopsis cynarae]|uniref:Alpha/beta fold hydrolase n=1 Tax=Amycolatopsis cynarae TaxID=2995223 RepID=A0ABY7B290_9PSEU|nr:alpha/beta fold hydrolase [Amycolatopsis sp. HUAS 11-8]WAL66420.1 alpha/beta fold hydrolase [Amycolatopsis sp. HUAS 11-8]